ncbi:MAG: TrmH family RNA methyltransferase [Leptospirillia bacterium]
MNPPSQIDSPQNPSVKAVVRLRRRRRREPSASILIDGGRALALALDRGIGLTHLYLCPDQATDAERKVAARAAQNGTAITHVAPAAFAKMAYGGMPDALVAVARRPNTALDMLPEGDTPPLLLIVDRVEKPGNLGALLRTADAAGVDGVILSDSVGDPFGPNTVRASRGTCFTVPVAEAGADDVVRWLTDHGIRPVTATPEATTPYTGADLTGPVAIVVGSEHSGLSERWRQGDVTPVSIPMRGAADSLNVSVASAVMLFEAARQRSAG